MMPICSGTSEKSLVS